MIQSWLGRLLLSPFSILYGIVISIRNALYDLELIKSTKFSIPVIAVGNLSIGGAGKSPHIEHLIRLLSPYLDVATLSRGYKRKTKGFRFVNLRDDVLAVGDEPLMFKRKHRNITVAVGESRAIAIPQMMAKYPNIQTILLDDAYQHRSITPGLNILLTTFDEPFTRDYLLPSGRLREWRSSYHRADIIVVSKCPTDLTGQEMEEMRKEINPKEHQSLFFSYYEYGYPYNFYDPKKRIRLDEGLDVILISAIANSQYLLNYLHQEVGEVHHLDYEDHHVFTERDLEYITTVFSNRQGARKLIITTEKDAMRLEIHRSRLAQAKIPIYILPMQVKFVEDEGLSFDETVKDYLLKFRY